MSRRKAKTDPWRAEVLKGWHTVSRLPLFRVFHSTLYEAPDGRLTPDTWAYVTAGGDVHFHPKRRAPADEWAWVFAHLLLHLAFGHADPRSCAPKDVDDDLPDPAYHAACCLAVERFLRTLKIGRCPAPLPAELPPHDEVALSELWRRTSVPDAYRPPGEPDFRVGTAELARDLDFPRSFAIGIADAATHALDVAGEPRTSVEGHVKGPWDTALRWFVSSYPLLGALAAGMKIVTDAELAREWDISIAAVSAEAGEIYVNPLSRQTEPGWRFVLAHEMLHAALRHGERAGLRDAYLWNVACDYVVNGWLVEMGVGEMPEGLLFDQSLTGMSAEAVYDRIATDLRRLRKLGTLRGRGLGDMLDRPAPPRRRLRRPRRLLPQRPRHRPGLPPVQRPRPAARRARTGDPRARPAAPAVGRPAGPLVRRALPPRGAAPHLRPRLPPPGRHPAHPPPRPDQARGGRAEGHVRGGARHLRLHGRQAARQGARRHRLLRRRPRRAARPRGVLRRHRLRRRLPARRGDRLQGQGARAGRHDPPARRPAARTRR
ncbi:hypothetical protein ABZW11_27710 [Nonomuraea sp. NPDC004580]|uniref:DUF2201 family putative metallopeptidase n=1 Tax=Nonomuraea sp. NPDC004580 TaxID=3154552 RepID=UPI00339F4453